MLNSIQTINEAIDNHDQRGIELDWPQQKALLYNFRALIKSKDRGLDEETAEVARLRTLLQEWNDLAQHQGLSTQAHRNRTAAALAAPPTAAVKAVEQMRLALEATICGACMNRIGWQGDFDAEQRRLGRSDWRTCTGCHDTRAALAAWKEALRG